MSRIMSAVFWGCLIQSWIVLCATAAASSACDPPPWRLVSWWQGERLRFGRETDKLKMKDEP